MRQFSDVSVLLPTFNRAAYIRAALLSIFAQTKPPSEVIVIDDGCSDETARVCAEFRDKIIYLRQPKNMGKTAAINRGLAAARRRFIWVMDDDDIAPPDALESLLAPLERDEHVGFSFGQLREFRQDGAGALLFEARVERPDYDARSLFVRLMEDCFITGQPCVLFRRSQLEAIGAIDESIQVSVDYNILLQVARRAHGVDVGKVVLWQRQHAGPRGPAAIQYAACERARRWSESDTRLIGALLPQLSLSEFLGYAQTRTRLNAGEVRRALMQKATIAARKNLWSKAARALGQARDALPGAPLSVEDRRILRQALGSRYGISQFLKDATIQREIARAAGRGRLGADIRMEIASRLTYWIGQYLKQRDPLGVVRAMAALLRLVGADAAVLLMRPLTKRVKFPERLPEAPRGAERPA